MPAEGMAAVAKINFQSSHSVSTHGQEASSNLDRGAPPTKRQIAPLQRLVDVGGGLAQPTPKILTLPSWPDGF